MGIETPEGVEAQGRTLESAQRLWHAALGDLQLQMTRATFDTWLRGSRVVSYEDELLTVYVRHTYAVDWLENRLSPVILRTLRRLSGPGIGVTFTTEAPEAEEHLALVPEEVPEAESRSFPGEESAAGLTGPARGSPQRWGTDAVSVQSTAAPGAPGQRRDSTAAGLCIAGASLVPRYTFGTFVVGASNRLAHAACLAVTENPAHAYNPLFVYGGAGLGKTHLLHAAGHAAQQRGLSVLYVSSESFTNDLIHAIRSQDTQGFRAKYRSLDMLLVDDIQFIAGKERTQEEFFHTFNTLHHAGKQIVVSCDRPPKSLVALEDRLRSRFGWGLIADVQPPDLETRIAILSAKAEGTGNGAHPDHPASPAQGRVGQAFEPVGGRRSSPPVPDEVLAYIARKVPSNIREMEGALNRVLAHARLMDTPLNLETARAALESILAQALELKPEQIVSTVARHYELSEDQLRGRSRVRAVSLPRQLTMYLIREETDASLPQIGQILGGRDHTTIMHGCDKIAARIETDEALRRDWLTIKQKLSEAGRPA